MPVVWRNLSVEERHKVCSLADTFSGAWSQMRNVLKITELGLIHLDDIDKMHSCYIMSKDDPTVFVHSSDQHKSVMATTAPQRQWILDVDYGAFAFAPN